MAKDLNTVLLFDLYGELLSSRQNSIFELYYNDDLSLSEISENTGITRQAVLDTVRHAEKRLTDIEEKLHLAEGRRKNSAAVDRAKELCSDIIPCGGDAALKAEEILNLLSQIDN